MKLPSLMSLPSDPWLEKWARYFRFQKAVPLLKDYLTKHKGVIRLIDYGSGQDILFYKFLSHCFPSEINRIEYIGIDPLAKRSKRKNIEIIPSQFEKVKLNKKADIAVMFAVLEHVDSPQKLLSHSLKLLKPKGIIIVTTPSWLSKPVLEFFSYSLGIIAVREIEEHKRYFSKFSLLNLGNQLLLHSHSINFTHCYFELGLNNLFVIRKT